MQVDAELTKHGELVNLPDDLVTMPSGKAAKAVGDAFLLQRDDADQCYKHLDKISSLGAPHD